MREIVFAFIQWNADYKPEGKPTKEQIMRLSIDERIEKVKSKKAPITKAEIEEMKKRLMSQINK